MSRRKKVTAAAIMLIVMILLLTGTFAWIDFSQHATNLFRGESVADVRLNDEFFYPPTDWHPSSVNAAVDKKVSVTNTQESNTVIYVRLQFKEYLETYNLTYTPITGDNGEIVLFATYADGPNTGEYMLYDDVPAGFNYEPWTVTIATGTEAVYARTHNAEIKNGIYGKLMNDPMIKPEKTVVTVFGEAEKADYSNQPHELQNASNAECNYEVHKWMDCGITDRLVHSDSIHNYIEWELGAEVITMADWLADPDPTLGEFWVLDTDGWAYWGKTLLPGTTTANIMESVTLRNMPGEAFSYYIHIDMQSVTADELGGFDTTTNDVFITALKAYVDPAVRNLVIAPYSGAAIRGTTIPLEARLDAVGDVDTAVEWTIKGTYITRSEDDSSPYETKDGSTINQEGELTISPAETAYSLTMTAMSLFDNEKKDEITIKLGGPLVTTITVAERTLGRGNSYTMIATVNGENEPPQGVTWKLEDGATSSSTKLEGALLTIGSDETATTLTVTATSTFDVTKEGSGTVNVQSVTGITVNENDIGVVKGKTQAFTAAVVGINDPATTVTWKVESGPTSSSTKFDGNVLTIGSTETVMMLTVTATSTVDGTTGSGIVKVQSVTSVTVDPASVDIIKGGTQTFTVNVVVINEPAKTVTWKLEDGATSSRTKLEGTTLTVGSDETATTLTVTATSTADGTTKGTATVTVKDVTVAAYSGVANNDGVDFSATTGLLASGSSIYYGTYDHATGLGASGTSTSGTVFSRRGVVEPIQWLVMGNSDGNITVMSRYVLDSLAFFPYSGTPTQNINYWRDSNVRAWLNNLNYTAVTEAAYTPSSPVPADYTSTGFLNNFLTSEQNQIADTTVNTTNYTYNSPPNITSAAISTTEKIFLPWGTYNTGSTGYQNRVWWGVDDTGLSTYPTGSATTNEITDKIGRLKHASGVGNGTAVLWWLRSPYSGYTYHALFVHTSGSVNGNSTYYVYGVRPAFRLNPESVIFTSQVEGDGATAGNPGVTSALNGYAASAAGAKNYKLTVLGGSSGAAVGTLTGIPATTVKKIVYTGSSTLDLKGLTSTAGGSDYTINYKIVDITTDPSNHKIIGYGEKAAVIGDNTLSIDTSTLSAGEFVVYVWLQKNNSISSNETTKPQCFWLEVKSS